MELKRAGSQSSQKGPAEYFTGTVRIDPLNVPPAPARAATAYVTFEPGARSAWHTHPLGQTLVVTAGAGWTQCEGGPIVEIRAGDVVWCPPGHKHWHGATPTTAMTHLAVTEALDGKNVEWMEKVTDEEYFAGPIKKSYQLPHENMRPERYRNAIVPHIYIDGASDAIAFAHAAEIALIDLELAMLRERLGQFARDQMTDFAIEQHCRVGLHSQ